MVPFENLQLPQDLVQKFEAWEEWYFGSIATRESTQNFPWDEFDARGLELAKELKAFLGPDQYLVGLPKDSDKMPSAIERI